MKKNIKKKTKYKLMFLKKNYLLITSLLRKEKFNNGVGDTPSSPDRTREIWWLPFYAKEKLTTFFQLEKLLNCHWE